MKDKNINTELNEISMDYQTYKKISGTLSPKDKSNITITSDKPSTTTNTSNTTSTSMAQVEESSVEPKDKETIKYISNVKDAKTGEISKPFVISNKRYQMIRGVNPSGEIIMAVYCFDDLDKNGENIIYPIDYFEDKIAKPIREKIEKETTIIDNTNIKEDNIDYASAENEFNDKEDFINYLNLADVAGYKHFFVNIKTGKITAKFKTTKEMMKSGIKLGPDEDYMDVKALKRFRFGEYFKGDLDESNDNLSPKDANTNIPKLKADVKKLADMIKNKFATYLDKIKTKPIQQVEFLTAMGNEIGVPFNKMTTLLNNYKDIAGTPSSVEITNPVSEKKILTKKEIEESLIPMKKIKVIKIKDIIK